jgi:hypothetical protein
MKRILAALGVVGAIGMTALFFGPSASAEDMGRVRVVHASPDAPAVEVYADGNMILTNVAYKASSDYLSVPAGPHNFKVYATGANPASDTPVINADATVAAGKDYTVVAVGKLADIQPAVFEDNNAAPASGKAHVRVIHASPDAPAVDIAVKGGPVLFSNLEFPKAAGPSPVDAGTYNLEVRAAGTTTVALPIDGVQLQAGKVYTVLAVGLLNGEPSLEALPIVNDPVAAPAPSAAPTAQPATLPASGTGAAQGGGNVGAMLAVVVGLGILAAGGGALAVAGVRRHG